ncbi:sporulation membrane protein YtaF [Alicyclobacillus mengziensis]|uniref:Sporulation membrane protein YtaF n=1 Tax=Alicyclobacillus mengziensis TaxID=2931921 RepID=A0A9X7Z899_9BACL|nr:sporulation membrane protein YtaF [Alicyclobacillus mengziensis]QSO49412.1 sporulation membrane protein YtaF [Alicyclobacillus mengziensis]
MDIVSWLLVLGFALSSSIDNFGVGMSYGVTKIRIGFWANLTIAVIAFSFSMTGIYFGHYITKLLPGTLSTVVAALFVLIIGVRIILISMMAKRKSARTQEKQQNGAIGRYLEDPAHADKDKSGEISIVESLVLGVAVSMNALTNGLGAGLMSLSPFAVSISAGIFSFLAIWWGVSLGERVANIRMFGWNLGQFSTLISGAILLLIAVHMVFTAISV